MILPQFEYHAPSTLEEACRFLVELPNAKVMAGATDMIPPMKDKAFTCEHVIDLKKIPGLDYLEYDEEEGLKIGALTTLFTLETSELVKEKNPAVAKAAKYVASTQIRMKGTMVGNICNASPSCDSAPILVVMGAKILVTGVDGSREIPIDEFFVSPRKTTLKPGEIVTGIVVPPLQENESAAYIKHAVRKAMDLAIVGVAARIKVENGICVDAALGLGAVAIKPVRAPEAEAVLIGKALTDDVIAEAAEVAKANVKPISDIRASKEYRADMIKVFTKRAVKEALESL